MTDDVVLIQQVLFRCCQAVDLGRPAEAASLFDSRGRLIVTWEPGPGHEGREAIGLWFENYDQALRAQMTYLRHKITCPVIEVRGDEATAVSYLDVEARPADGGRMIITVCRYEDKLVRRDGAWLFAEKVIHMDNQYALG